MQSRPATADDVPAIAELGRQWETHWLGGPEESEDELREFFDRADVTRVLLDDGRITAAAWRAGDEAVIVVDPARPPGPSYANLLPWLAEHKVTEVTALSRDEAFLEALTGQGWQHVNSSFDLIHDIEPGWVLAEPSWPDGITVRALGDSDAAAIHRLIYVDSGWAEVPGHHERTFDDWRAIFLNEHALPEQQVLAWRGDRLVGIAMGRTFDDGTGWVAQLAVAKDERGHGLGRAMLLDALARRRAGGATAVGLSVSQVNRGALQLYLGVGLEIQREWMAFISPA